jgi:hypothetical protein
VVDSLERAAVLARARDVIDRVERTVAEPRPIGAAWEGKADEPAPAPPPVPPPRSAPQGGVMTWDSFHHVLKVGIAPPIAEALEVRDKQIHDLEQRLASVEALLAKARGSTQ